MLRSNTKILFFGIYDFGMASLERLADPGFNIVGVVTKPEQEGGKQACAAWGRLNGIPVFAPASPKDEAFIAQIRRLQPDRIVVAGYHKVIPKMVLDIPTLGAFNLHAGLLPAYRGPCAWKWAIINGETSTGVTVHVMTPELDRGDILSQRSFAISNEDTGRSLFHKFSKYGATLLVETLQKMETEGIAPQPQNESLASYFSYPTEQDAGISWYQSANTIRNLVRALSPSAPGAWTQYKGYRLIIDSAQCARTRSGKPGQVISCDDQEIVVGTATDDLAIRALHLKKDSAQSIATIQKTTGLRPGESFENARSSTLVSV